MSEAAFTQWLTAYGDAWGARDADRFAALFADDVSYHWTPFRAPERGPAGVRAAFAAATDAQHDPRFSFEVIAMRERVGWATWRCDLVRAETGTPFRIDGVLSARFDESGRCAEFREWWHSNEHETTPAEEEAHA